MRKTDETLREHEGFMVHLVVISALFLGLFALVAFGVLDDVLRALAH